MSRRPKPTILKLQAGNPGRRRLNAREPRPARGLPEPPPGLPAAELVQWHYWAGLTHELGVLTRPDAPALARVATLAAELLELDQLLSREPHFYEVRGLKRAHPALAVRADLDRRFHSWLVEFGCTPSSRTKVATEPQRHAHDPSEAYFK